MCSFLINDNIQPEIRIQVADDLKRELKVGTFEHKKMCSKVYLLSAPQAAGQPACVALVQVTAARAASACCCVLSVGAILCHAAVSGATALSYCVLPYGSQ